MKPIQGAIWLLPLAVGCIALPAQLQVNSRNASKTKQNKTASLHLREGGSNDSAIMPNGSRNIDENSIDVNVTGNNDVDSAILSKPLPLGISATIESNAVLASSLPSSPSTTSASTSTSTSTSISTSTWTDHPLAGMTELSPTSGSSSPPISKTEFSSATTSNRGTTTSTRIALNTGASNTSLSVFPTEASSRTIATNRDTAALLSSSKKSTTNSNELITTPATAWSKETRESPGKIRPQIKLTTNYANLSETGVRLPEGASAALAKPTKYHYYPHNQHIYLLPECAVQQVCNAVYVRLNFTQPLCACPGRYRDPCSASLDSDDLHTTELVTDPRTKALTLVKTCEPVAEMRECRIPRDWSLLALQNVRTGKSHYLVICRCPDANILEGPMSHDQPTYASVPGIRVYGMMCVQGNRKGRQLRYTRALSDRLQRETDQDSHNDRENTNERLNFPWYKVQQLMDIAVWD
ncbi:uncharacterized protein LOC132912388 [Bombus pascuorum]|uniref:uncharacterized protein LOC132912388 n=1 Tax=Bombus pascuorum TaxID=65598 RepID=UPI0021209B4B|nr:uncharacterized protein LOC132912388 [Bombus pascuorum]